MEMWLRSNNIPKEKKQSPAVQAFTGNAYKWWLKESSPSIYNQPVVDWRDLKVRMYKEFAEKYQDQVDATSKFHCPATPRKVMSTPKLHAVPKPKKAHDHEPKKISSSVLTHQEGFKRSAQLHKAQPQSITTPLPELQKLQEMCQKLKETLEPKEENTSNQGVNTCPKEHDSIKEEPPGGAFVMNQNKVLDIMHYMLPKEEAHVWNIGTKRVMSIIFPTNGGRIQAKVLQLKRVNHKKVRPRLNVPELLRLLQEKSKDFETGLGTQKKCTAQRQRTPVLILGTEATDYMGEPHKEVTRCLDAKVKQEVTTRNSLIPDDPPGHATPIRMPDQIRGVVMSSPLKEEPPDVPSKIKPIKYQGRGYDAAIKSVAEPEANQLHQTANPKTHQDMCSIKTAYLTNQEDIVHETNFPALYAQQGVNPNWNHHQRYSAQEDMNLTNR
ncbi:uncharacterized protein LOC117129548, partial [Brassica rapa]|uniref:uncharacterized protein LOC117129548 n=1 Tax=Brassica campestris TaxID=3711 RepID=UPI00142DB9F3